MTNDSGESSRGLIGRIQTFPTWQRVVIFVTGVVVVLLLFLLLVYWFILQSVSLGARITAKPVAENVTVTEFATLDDVEAYPAALAVTADGTVITGSYVNGILWAINGDGDVSEIQGTGQAISSITGLTTSSDGDIYVLDRLDPLLPSGATVWRVSQNGDIAEVVSIPVLNDPENSDDASFAVFLPDDIELDAEGRIYITDRGMDRIWRMENDGTNPEIWWSSAGDQRVTGLAFDRAGNAMIVTDSATDTVLRIDIETGDAETVYDHQTDDSLAPGFDGVTVSPDGRIFVATLATNGVAEIGDEGMSYLAGTFRGSSDVAFDATTGRLFVTNWDQRALLPVDVFGLQFETQPRLPFGIDAITFSGA